MWRVPLIAWALSRLLVIGVGTLGSIWLGWGGSTDRSVPRAMVLLGSWDTGWYMELARQGYDLNTQAVGVAYTNLAFFPLLPLLLRLGITFSINPFFWGLIICNVAFLGALLAFHRISCDRRGLAFANRATWILALSPPAVYASLVYTDGIMVGLATGAALAATRGRWYLAGACAAAAALLRPQGILVAVLIALIALIPSGVPRTVRLRNAVIGGLPGFLALGGFLTWMQVARGSWSLPQKAEAAWGRPSPGVGILTSLWQSSYNIVADPITHGFASFIAAMTWTGNARDLLITIPVVLLLIPLWRSERTWRSPWAIFATLAVLVPLAGGGVGSMTRYSLLAFPLVWPVANWLGNGERRWVQWVAPLALILMVALVLQLHYVQS